MILDFLGDNKRCDERIFRHLAYYGIEDRKVVEYALQRLLCADIIKESREGNHRYFERITKRHSLLF